MSTLTHPAQYYDQQPVARDHSHEGSRGHAPQHSSQAEGRDQHTVNGTHYMCFLLLPQLPAIRYYAVTSMRPDSSPPPAKRKRLS